MELQSDGIFLGQKKLGESQYVARVFSQDFGLISGVIRSGKQGGHVQSGEYVRVRWRARLEEHLGQSVLERLGGFMPLELSPRALQGLMSMTSLLQMGLNEREQESRLYAETEVMLQSFSGADWAFHYLEWERIFLQTMGFGLDLEQCAAGCSARELPYISPKSGRAVCAEHGAPYHEQLFAMPECWQNSSQDMRDIVAGLRIIGYFLDSAFSVPQGVTAFRKRFLHALLEEV